MEWAAKAGWKPSYPGVCEQKLVNTQKRHGKMSEASQKTVAVALCCMAL